MLIPVKPQSALTSEGSIWDQRQSLRKIKPNYAMMAELAVNDIIRQESAGNPKAVSPRGAMGLMQLMPTTASNPGFGIRPTNNPFDEKENIRVGKEYFTAMLSRYKGDIEAALVAYNWGPGNADSWVAKGKNRRRLPAETQNYVNKLLPRINKSVYGDSNAPAAGMMYNSMSPISEYVDSYEGRTSQGGYKSPVSKEALLYSISKPKEAGVGLDGLISFFDAIGRSTSDVLDRTIGSKGALGLLQHSVGTALDGVLGGGFDLLAYLGETLVTKLPASVWQPNAANPLLFGLAVNSSNTKAASSLFRTIGQEMAASSYYHEFAKPAESWTDYLDPRKVAVTFADAVPYVLSYMANPALGLSVTFASGAGDEVDKMRRYEELGMDFSAAHRIIMPLVNGSIDTAFDKISFGTLGKIGRITKKFLAESVIDVTVDTAKIAASNMASEVIKGTASGLWFMYDTQNMSVDKRNALLNTLYDDYVVRVREAAFAGVVLGAGMGGLRTLANGEGKPDVRYVGLDDLGQPKFNVTKINLDITGKDISYDEAIKNELMLPKYQEDLMRDRLIGVGFTSKEINATLTMFRLRASKLGQTTEEFIERNIAGVNRIHSLRPESFSRLFNLQDFSGIVEANNKRTSDGNPAFSDIALTLNGGFEKSPHFRRVYDLVYTLPILSDVSPDVPTNEIIPALTNHLRSSGLINDLKKSDDVNVILRYGNRTFIAKPIYRYSPKADRNIVTASFKEVEGYAEYLSNTPKFSLLKDGIGMYQNNPNALKVNLKSLDISEPEQLSYEIIHPSVIQGSSPLEGSYKMTLRTRGHRIVTFTDILSGRNDTTEIPTFLSQANAKQAIKTVNDLTGLDLNDYYIKRSGDTPDDNIYALGVDVNKLSLEKKRRLSKALMYLGHYSPIPLPNTLSGIQFNVRLNLGKHEVIASRKEKKQTVEAKFGRSYLTTDPVDQRTKIIEGRAYSATRLIQRNAEVELNRIPTNPDWITPTGKKFVDAKADYTKMIMEATTFGEIQKVAHLIKEEYPNFDLNRYMMDIGINALADTETNTVTVYNPDAVFTTNLRDRNSSLNNEFRQGAKAFISFRDDGKAVINLFEKVANLNDEGDFASFVHEVGHLFRNTLTPIEKDSFDRIMKIKNGNWTREAHERFAIGYERFFVAKSKEFSGKRKVDPMIVGMYHEVHNLMKDIFIEGIRDTELARIRFTEAHAKAYRKLFEETGSDSPERNTLLRTYDNFVKLFSITGKFKSMGYERVGLALANMNTIQKLGIDQANRTLNLVTQLVPDKSRHLDIMLQSEALVETDKLMRDLSQHVDEGYLKAITNEHSIGKAIRKLDPDIKEKVAVLVLANYFKSIYADLHASGYDSPSSVYSGAEKYLIAEQNKLKKHIQKIQNVPDTESRASLTADALKGIDDLVHLTDSITNRNMTPIAFKTFWDTAINKARTKNPTLRNKSEAEIARLSGIKAVDPNLYYDQAIARLNYIKDPSEMFTDIKLPNIRKTIKVPTSLRAIIESNPEYAEAFSLTDSLVHAGQSHGWNMAIQEIRNSIVYDEAGFIGGPAKQPVDGYVKDTTLSAFRDMYMKAPVHEYIKKMVDLQTGKYGSVFAALKSFQFWSPLKIVVDDMFNAVAATQGRLLADVPTWSKAFKAVLNKDNLYKEAYEEGVEFAGSATSFYATNKMFDSAIFEANLINNINKTFRLKLSETAFDKIKTLAAGSAAVLSMSQGDPIGASAAALLAATITSPSVYKNIAAKAPEHTGSNLRFVGDMSMYLAKLPINAIKEVYNTASSASQSLSDIIRIATYVELKRVGKSNHDAAQIVSKALFNYGDVPAGTKAVLNTLFITPSYKIGIVKSATAMVNSSFKMFTNQADSVGKSRVGALGFILGTFVAVDAVMVALGLEREEWGYKYRHTTANENGYPVSVNLTYNVPHNLFIKQAYRLDRAFSGYNNMEGVRDYVLSRNRAELHPLWQVAIEYADQRTLSGDPIYNAADPQSVKIAKSLEYYTKRFVPLLTFGREREPATFVETKTFKKDFGDVVDALTSLTFFKFDTKTPEAAHISRIRRIVSDLKSQGLPDVVKQVEDGVPVDTIVRDKPEELKVLIQSTIERLEAANKAYDDDTYTNSILDTWRTSVRVNVRDVYEK